MFLPPRRPGGAAGDQQSLICAGAGFGRRRGLQIHVYIIGDEEIEMAVLVVIDPSAAGVPADFGPWLQQAGFLGHVGEGAVTVIAIKHVLTVVSDE
jgi:hypothetical protein